MRNLIVGTASDLEYDLAFEVSVRSLGEVGDPHPTNADEADHSVRPDPVTGLKEIASS